MDSQNAEVSSTNWQWLLIVHNQNQPQKTQHTSTMPSDPLFDRLFRALQGDDDDGTLLGSNDSFSQSLPSSWQRQQQLSSRYDVHRDENQVQVDVDVPGVASKDLKVEVLHNAMCVIQWSGSRRRAERNNNSNNKQQSEHTFANRLRLGSSVDLLL